MVALIFFTGALSIAPLKSIFAAKVGAKAAVAKTGDVQEVLVDKERRRLEELFIWKMSEELKLPVEQETQFANLMRSLNREKSKTNLAVASALDEISRAQAVSDPTKSRAAIEKAVKNYEKAWLAYGRIPLNEVRRMRQLLGPERLGKYLIAKSVMAEKMMALSVREASEATATPPSSPTPKP